MISEKQKRELLGLALLALTLFFTLSLIPPAVLGSAGGRLFPSGNIMGVVGTVLAENGLALLGAGIPLLPFYPAVGAAACFGWMRGGTAVRTTLLLLGLDLLLPTFAFLFTPTAGAEIKTGSARVNTGGAAIPFGGLAQGGGGAGGVQLDVKNFCCPEYLTQMVQKIRSNWNANQGAGGQPIIKFVIRRDGVLTNVELEKSSGQALLDLEARRAVHKTAQLPPLPREFPDSSLTIHLTFDFQR